MSDIVERLRALSGAGCDWRSTQQVTEDAADEIERLRERLAEVAALYQAGLDSWNPVYEVVCKERNDLRSRLAEAEKLLSAWRAWYWDAASTPAMDVTVLDATDAALGTAEQQADVP